MDIAGLHPVREVVVAQEFADVAQRIGQVEPHSTLQSFEKDVLDVVDPVSQDERA